MRHNKLICLCVAGIALCYAFTSLATYSPILDDHFDSDHTYYDGSTVDVSGTPWDGVYGQQYLEGMDANITSPSCLSMDLGTNLATSIGGSDYAFPMLYKNVSGDFVAEMWIKNPIPEPYIIYLLGCVDTATSNDYMAGAFPMAPVWGFWDYHAAHTAGSRVLDAGVGPYVADNMQFRVVRKGNDFMAYSRPGTGDDWHLFGAYTHPETLPATLSVGPLVAEHVVHGYTYEYERLVIYQDTYQSLWEERFDYPDGWSDTVTGGRWLVWLGPDNSDPVLITNDTAYGSSGSQMRLNNYDLIGHPSPVGFQEVSAYTPQDLFAESDVGTIGFSFATPGSSNAEYYLWYCSGDPAVTNFSYTSSGLGSFIVNWVRQPTNSALTSLHVWNDFGIFEVALNIPTDPFNPVWHDVRAILWKELGPNNTGGWAEIYLDGNYMGDVPFPLQDANNIVIGIINGIDYYQVPITPATGPGDRCLIDNIFIQDTAGYTRYVSPYGNDSNDGQNDLTPYATIANAMWQIPSGCIDYPSTIMIAPGVYENEHTVKEITNWWQWGLYCRGGAVERPNIYCVDIIGAGAADTIIHQDFSQVDGIGDTAQTMGIYARGLKDWYIEGIQVRMTTNMPQDVWAWWYSCFQAGWSEMHDIEITECIANMPIGWALGKVGFRADAVSNIYYHNNLSIGGGVGFGINSNPQNLRLENNTFVGTRQGTGEGNSGCGVAFNGASATVYRCMIVDCDKGALLAGGGDVMHSVMNNLYNCGTGGTNYYYQGTIIPTDDIHQAPVFDTAEGLPYRCGSGNVGYMSGLSTVYFDSAAPGGHTLGLTPGTAFNSLSNALYYHSGGVGNPEYASVMILDGTHTNQVNYTWNNDWMYRVFPPYLDIQGESVAGTIMLYTGSDTYAGLNLGAQGTMLRDMTVTRDVPKTDWSWFDALVESWFAEDVVISNVQIISPVGAGDSAQGCIHYYAGNNREVYNTLCAGGTVGFGVNVGGVVSMFDSCTFVDNNGTGDGSGQTAFAVMDDGDVVIAQNIIVQDTASVGRPGNANATININNLLTNNVAELQVSGTPGTLNVTGMLVSDDPGLTSGGGLWYMTGNPTYEGWGWRSISGTALSPEPWPLNGNNPQRQGYYVDGTPLTAATIVWTNDDLVGIGIWGSGASDSETFYINTDENPGELKAIDLATGATIWNADLQDWANGTPAVAMSYVYCSDNLGVAYCIDKATGSSVWETVLGGRANGGTLLKNGRVYVETDAVGLFCLDADTGGIIWSNVQATADQGWQGNGPSMNAAEDTVYYTAGGVVLAVDVATGNTIWSNVFGTNQAWSDEKEPIVDDSGNLYAALGGLTNEPDNDILVSMQSDGTIRWVYDFGVNDAWQGGGYALNPEGRTIYCTVGNDLGGVIAINTLDGTEKWRATVGNTKGGPVVAAGNMIISVFNDNGNAAAIGIRDDGTAGTTVWNVPLNIANDSWSWPTILENGDMIVEAENGVIARLTIPEPGMLGALILGLLLLFRRK
jgi:outer membrane protein assembly factor BamB